MRVLGLLLCLLLPFAVVAQEDTSDRGFVQGLLEDALSGGDRVVRIEGFEGALSSRATITKITVADADGIWLTLKDVAMTWSRRALLSGVLDIDEISVGSLSLPRAPLPEEGAISAEASGGFALPELPVSINLRKLEVKRADFGKPLFGEAASLSLTGSADLAEGSGNANLAVKRLDRGGNLTFTAAYKALSNALTLALNLSEPDDGIAAHLLKLPDTPPLALTIDGAGPLDDFAAELRLSTEGEERLRGQVTLRSTDAGGTGFDATLGGDLAPVLAPKYRDFLGRNIELRAQGQSRADGALVLNTLSLSAAALSLEGRAAFDAEGWPETLQLQGEISPPDGKRVILPLPGPTLSVQGASLQLDFDAAEGDRFSFVTDALRLHRDADTVEQLSLSARGTIDRDVGSVQAGVTFDAAGFTPADAAMAKAAGRGLAGTLDLFWQQDAPIKLRNVDFQGADYGLSGQLDIAAVPGTLDARLLPNVTLRAQDLSRFDLLSGLDLGGSAALEIAGEVLPVAGQFDLSFGGITRDLITGIARLDPLLVGQGRLSANLKRDTDGVRADPVEIRTDLARIAASGTLAEGASTLKAEARIAEVAVVVPELHGAATVVLTARQSGTLWTVEASGGLPGETKFVFDGTVTAQSETARLAKGVLSAEVSRLSAFSTLAGQSLSGSATLNAEGGADLQTQSFNVTAKGTTRALSLGNPTLTALLAGRVQVDTTLSRGADGVMVIDRLALDGPALDADASGRLAPDNSELRYQAQLPNLAVIVPELPGAASLGGTALRANGPWRVDANGTGPGGIRIGIVGTAAEDASRVDLSLDGSAPLGLANPYLSGQSVSGLALFDLDMTGPVALTSLSGQVRTDNARLFLADQSMVIEPINGVVTLSGGQALVDLTARLRSGGKLDLRGPIRLQPPFVAALQGRLRDALLREEDLFEADLDGEFTLDGPLQGGARIGGDVLVQSVELRIPNLSPSYSALEGLEHRNLPADVRQTLEFAGMLGASQQGAPPPDFPINLTIRAPSRVFVRGRGLDAELGGVLRLSGSTANVVPQGQFDLIRGRLDLLGRRLTLTEGSVSLRGSFDPVINFAATTNVEDVSITLRIEGEASAPELTVTSAPELPQDEALSLFLFGRDPTQISALQAVQLAAAIRTLSGRGGLGLTEGLRTGLGVDDLDVSTDADGNAQASVGKYISDRAYTSVTVNSEGNSQIQLNFDVSPNVTLRGRVTSEGETGLGIFFERNY